MKLVIEQKLSTPGLFNCSEIFTKNGEQRWVYNLISLTECVIMRKISINATVKYTTLPKIQSRERLS